MTRAAVSRGRLPLHPRPFPHEALSSWVGRLATAYSMESDAFLHAAFGTAPAPDSRELDTCAGPPGLVAALAEQTGVSRRRIRAMTLAATTPEMTGPCALAGRPGWFAAQADDDEGRSESVGPWVPWQAEDLLIGMPRCCPTCLVLDPVPYVRLHWLGAWMASCPMHKEALVPVITDPWRYRRLIPRERQHAAPNVVDLDRITLGAVTGGMAHLPGRDGPVLGAAWLRALRALLSELTCPRLWFDPQARAGVGAAWRRAGWTFGMRELCQAVAFERLLPDLRSILLDVAGAEVQHRAGRRAPGGKATLLRSTVMQWSAGQRCGAETA